MGDRIRSKDDCAIYYKLYYHNPKLRPAKNCDAIRGAWSDLEKHLKYHFHLIGQEKAPISLNNDDTQRINRGGLFPTRTTELRYIHIRQQNILQLYNRNMDMYDMQ